MATEKQVRDVSRLSSLTYMISACLNFSIENLNKNLEAHSLKLSGRDKQVFNIIRNQIKQLQTNLNIIEGFAFNVLGDDEHGKLIYEDSVHIYWVVFLMIVDRAGTDNLCDLRFMALTDIVSKYKSLLNLPGIDTAYYQAFAQVSKSINEGKYSITDFKNLLELDENRIEEIEG